MAPTFGDLVFGGQIFSPSDPEDLPVGGLIMKFEDGNEMLFEDGKEMMYE